MLMTSSSSRVGLYSVERALIVSRALTEALAANPLGAVVSPNPSTVSGVESHT